MCFSVKVDINLKKLAESYKAKLVGVEDYKIQETPRGFLKTERLPVLYRKKGSSDLQVEMMNWSLVPSWSKEYPFKPNTYNARMERVHKGASQKIYEVPSFKDAFRERQFCMVPIRSAIESCYWGDTAGKVVSFNRVDKKNFFALGLYNPYFNQETKEIVNTCTLLTDGPDQYLFEHGHDRSIILLNNNASKEIIFNESLTYEDSFELIRKGRVTQEWDYEVIRDVSEKTLSKNKPSEEELQEIRKTVFKQAL